MGVKGLQQQQVSGLHASCVVRRGHRVSGAVWTAVAAQYRSVGTPKSTHSILYRVAVPVEALLVFRLPVHAFAYYILHVLLLGAILGPAALTAACAPPLVTVVSPH